MASRIPRQAHWEVDMQLVRTVSAAALSVGLALLSLGANAQQYVSPTTASLGPAMRTLAGPEVRALLSGRTLTGYTPARRPYSQTFYANGTVRSESPVTDPIRAAAGEKDVRTGTWEVQGNLLGVHWSNGGNFYWPIATDGQGHYYNANNMNQIHPQ